MLNKILKAVLTLDANLKKHYACKQTLVLIRSGQILHYYAMLYLKDLSMEHFRLDKCRKMTLNREVNEAKVFLSLVFFLRLASPYDAALLHSPCGGTNDREKGTESN